VPGPKRGAPKGTNKEAELLSAGEYLTKKANLYNEYARIPSSQITDLLIGKLTS
jgi:hypothetical protein